MTGENFYQYLLQPPILRNSHLPLRLDVRASSIDCVPYANIPSSAKNLSIGTPQAGELFPPTCLWQEPKLPGPYIIDHAV